MARLPRELELYAMDVQRESDALAQRRYEWARRRGLESRKDGEEHRQRKWNEELERQGHSTCCECIYCRERLQRRFGRKGFSSTSDCSSCFMVHRHMSQSLEDPRAYALLELDGALAYLKRSCGGVSFPM